MKHYRKELSFHLPHRRGLVNITSEVQKAIDESGIREGLVLVNACTSLQASSSTMTNPVSITIGRYGWKDLRRKSPTAGIGTTGMRTTPTPT